MDGLIKDRKIFMNISAQIRGRAREFARGRDESDWLWCSRCTSFETVEEMGQVNFHC